MKIVRWAAALVLATTVLGAAPAASADQRLGKHVTVEQLEVPPFTTCMEHAGQPTVPVPGATERRSWPTDKQASYKTAFWACARSSFDLN